MESATTILLIAVTALVGLFLVIKGIRGAIKSWKGKVEDGI